MNERLYPLILHLQEATVSGEPVDIQEDKATTDAAEPAADASAPEQATANGKADAKYVLLSAMSLVHLESGILAFDPGFMFAVKMFLIL